jgi:hypothetical protein
MASGLVNRFSDHLYTRLITTSNCSATDNLQNSQISTAPAKPFPACYVFTSRPKATASNSRNSSASRAQVLSSYPPVQNSTHCSSCLGYSMATCLQIRCPQTAAARTTENTVLLLLHACKLRALLSDGHCLKGDCLATDL